MATLAICAGVRGSRTMRRMKSRDRARSMGWLATACAWYADLRRSGASRLDDSW